MTELENKKYNPGLGSVAAFFTPHPDANHLNAQDAVHGLVSNAKDLSIAVLNCFDDEEGLVIKDTIVANLIYDIQTKLEMIERVLPMAFGYEVPKHAEH